MEQKCNQAFRSLLSRNKEKFAQPLRLLNHPVFINSNVHSPLLKNIHKLKAENYAQKNNILNSCQHILTLWRNGEHKFIKQWSLTAGSHHLNAAK